MLRTTMYNNAAKVTTNIATRRCTVMTASMKDPSKYCFQSMSPIYEKIPGKKPRHVGIVVAFGKTPLVSKEVERIVNLLQKENEIDTHGDIDLVCFEECPVEISDDVFVHMFGKGSMRFPKKNL